MVLFYITNLMFVSMWVSYFYIHFNQDKLWNRFFLQSKFSKKEIDFIKNNYRFSFLNYNIVRLNRTKLFIQKQCDLYIKLSTHQFWMGESTDDIKQLWKNKYFFITKDGYKDNKKLRSITLSEKMTLIYYSVLFFLMNYAIYLNFNQLKYMDLWFSSLSVRKFLIMFLWIYLSYLFFVIFARLLMMSMIFIGLYLIDILIFRAAFIKKIRIKDFKMKSNFINEILDEIEINLNYSFILSGYSEIRKIYKINSLSGKTFLLKEEDIQKIENQFNFNFFEITKEDWQLVEMALNL